MAVGELCLIAKDISSLLEVPLNPSISSLNLHCNRLTKIEGSTTAWHIRHLDLSSNHICHIEGLASLSSLHTLNLSCNLITKVEGLLYLHGADYKLKYLQLHSNHLDSMNHLLQCMVGLQNLKNVTFSKDGAQNPVCSLPDPSVNGELGNSNAPLTTPRIGEVVTQFRQQGGKPTEENQENEQRIKKLEQQVSHLIQKVPTGDGFKVNSAVPSVAIVEERDQERERRWKAEQAAKRLSEQVKNLQTQASKEKDLQSLALHTSDRKELAMRLLPGGTEVKEAVAKEVVKIQQRFAQKQKQTDLEQKFSDARRQYGALEDEFCMALTIEAKRFSESCIQSLESRLEDDQRLNLQVELLKKDKSKLLSQLTAQESLIDGLRAERKIWGQELAQQGASLAQDRG
ncbi:hypothetical protein cypCar_00023850 [Cyprinus carpio]|nr:hypothetical protein cypCar_00023850 [Cyprinus carpio]